MHTNEELDNLLQMSLEDKITMSKLRITEFYEHYNGNVVVSFSGGKDSTVLLHLVRSLFPDVKGVYCDTGLEYPELKEFVKKKGVFESGRYRYYDDWSQLEYIETMPNKIFWRVRMD